MGYVRIYKSYKGVISKSCKCDYSVVIYLLYGLATTINTFGALSLPYAPAPYTFAASIQFNEFMFDGMVNEVAVQNLSILRVSFATYCLTA